MFLKNKIFFNILCIRECQNNIYTYTRATQKVKNVCAYRLCTCFVAANHWFLVFSVILKSCLMQLYVGSCQMVSAVSCGHDCVDWEFRWLWGEVRGVICFLQANEILGYLPEEASSCIELFCCMTMHVRILPDNTRLAASAISSVYLRASVRTWHRQTFSCFQKWRSTLLVNASQMMKTWRMLSVATWYDEGKLYTNWCQGTSALMSKATMCNSRQRYVPKLLYSVSVLLNKIT